MLLTGQKVCLRPVEERDLALLVSWRNKPEIWQHFFNKFPLALAAQNTWLGQLVSSSQKKLFMICPRGNDQPVGTLGLDSIDFANQTAEIGNVLIAKSGSMGQGVASEALQLLLEFCFNHLNINRIGLEVFAENQRAIRLYEKFGFVKEGVLRESHFAMGGFKDTLLMGLLRRDYRAGYGLISQVDD